MSQEQRINIRPLVREFHNQGYIDNPLITNGFLHNSVIQENVPLWWAAMRPEVYALSSVLIDRIVNRAVEAREARPPFGLVLYDYQHQSIFKTVETSDLTQRGTIFSGVNACMLSTFLESIDAEFAEIRSGKSPQEVQTVYKRLTEILPLARNILDVTRYESPRFLIASGATFAAKTMTSFTHMLPQIPGSPRDVEILGQIADNSYPFIVKVASRDLDSATKVVKALSCSLPQAEVFEPFSPEYFGFAGSGNNIRVDLSQAGYARLLSQGLSLDDEPTSGLPLIGCPALINFKQGSAIAKLWEWHVDIAKQIYSL